MYGRVLGWYYEGGIDFNAAFVDAALNEKVAGETPIGSPRITDDPVVDSVEIAPSNQHNGVIDGLSITSRIVVHAAPASAS